MITLIPGSEATLKNLKKFVGSPIHWYNYFPFLNFKNNRYLVLDANEEILDLYRAFLGTPQCNLEIRKNGILLWFKMDTTYVLPLPFYALTVFKGSDYLQVYGGKWRIKLGSEGSESLDHKIIRDILMMKHKSVSDHSQYYG